MSIAPDNHRSTRVPAIVLEAIMKEEQASMESAMAVAGHYERVYQTMEGAPEPEALTVEDALAVWKLGASYSKFISSQECRSQAAVEQGKEPMPIRRDWTAYRSFVVQMALIELDPINPYLAIWTPKADGQTNGWLINTGVNADSAKQDMLNALMRFRTAKCRGGDIPFAKGAFQDREFINEIVDAMVKVIGLFVRHNKPPFGTSSSHEFEWGSSLCLLAFLGLDGMQRLFAALPENEAFQHWAVCPQKELSDSINEARRLSGYACGILFLDYMTLTRVVHSMSFSDPHANKPGKIPTWYRSAIALHLLKHCRYLPPTLQCPRARVRVAFRGVHSNPEVPDPVQPLSAAVNRPLAKELCRILGIPFRIGGKEELEWFEIAVHQVLDHLHPIHLPPVRALESRLEFVVSPATQIIESGCPVDEESVNTGVAVTGLARINLDTGKVDPDARVDGIDALAYDWPIAKSNVDVAEYRHWKANLPKQVRALRASDYLRERVKNLNDFGHSDGFNAVLDSIMTIALARNDLAGSVIGQVVRKEFPLVFIMPTGSTVEESTNQGKTTLCALLAGALMPGVQPTKMSTGSSPAQRSMMLALERYHGGIIDEYTKPCLDHVLNKEGMMTLATGGQVSAGKAMENAPPFALKMLLFFSSKLAPEYVDVLNRIFPIFLDVLNANNQTTPQALVAMASGAASLEMRLCHLRWMHLNQVTKAIAALPETAHSGGVWRFHGHLAVAYGLAGREKVDAYLRAAFAHCAVQLENAEHSGQTDAIFGTPRFDVRFFWEEASIDTLDGLALESKNGGLTAGRVLRSLVTNTPGDQSRSQFAVIIGRSNRDESKLIEKFTKALRLEPFVRQDGWKLYLARDGKGRQVRVAVVRIVPSAADKLAAEVMKMESTSPPANRLTAAATGVAEDPLAELIPGLAPWPGSEWYDYISELAS